MRTIASTTFAPTLTPIPAINTMFLSTDCSEPDGRNDKNMRGRSNRNLNVSDLVMFKFRLLTRWQCQF